MLQASYYKVVEGETIRCTLCPHQCKLEAGEIGKCRVRKNEAGKLISENYGKVCSLRFDPIEKKPFYHFYPGMSILSVGSVGCNLGCKFCQNWEISQTGVPDFPFLKDTTPREVIDMALSRVDSAGIAFTYNEPTVWFEFMLNIAKLAKEKGLKCVSITNGYITKDPLEELMRYVDAFNIDLKSFSNDFYRQITNATLKPVLDSIIRMKTAGKHIELTHLVVTELNDDEEEFKQLVRWIRNETGKDTPLHISRYFPVYKMNKRSTSVKTMERFYEIASAELDFVYIGNMGGSEGQNTRCPACGNLVIERSGYSTYKVGLDSDGNCKDCKRIIISHR
jgi:pyruvate formate lyase activating enzyme